MTAPADSFNRYKGWDTSMLVDRARALMLTGEQAQVVEALADRAYLLYWGTMKPDRLAERYASARRRMANYRRSIKQLQRAYTLQAGAWAIASQRASVEREWAERCRKEADALRTRLASAAVVAPGAVERVG